MAEPFLLTMMLHQLKVLAFVISEDPNSISKGVPAYDNGLIVQSCHTDNKQWHVHKPTVYVHSVSSANYTFFRI
jgi:hypothetical protein